MASNIKTRLIITVVGNGFILREGEEIHVFLSVYELTNYLINRNFESQEGEEGEEDSNPFSEDTPF